MTTDDLIARLAAAPRPAPGLGGPLVWAPTATAVFVGLPALAVLGLRPDLVRALNDPVTAAKWALPLALAALSFALALRLARPEARLGARALLFAPVLALAGALVASALAALPPFAWGSAIRGGTRAACLLSVLGLSLGPLAAALWALSRGASTAPRLSGLLAGLGAGGLAAALYALHCIEDAPPFFVTWYGLGILGAGGLGVLLGPRALRW